MLLITKGRRNEVAPWYLLIADSSGPVILRLVLLTAARSKDEGYLLKTW